MSAPIRLTRSLILLSLLLAVSSARAGTIRKSLPNGLDLHLIPDGHRPVVVIKLMVASGSAVDPEGKEGLARLTAFMLNQGSSSFPSEELLVGAIEEEGGVLDIAAGFDSSTITVKGPAGAAAPLISILSDMVANPLFPAVKLDALKRATQALIESRRRAPLEVTGLLLENLLFTKHPYRHLPEGKRTSLLSIKKKDLESFHASHYVPGNVSLAVAGDLEPAGASGLIKKHFGSWKGEGKKAGAPTLPLKKIEPGTYLYVREEQRFAEIRACLAIVSGGDPDFLPLRIVETVLGGSPGEGRLEEVFLTSGSAAAAGSALGRRIGGSPLGVRLVSSVEKVPESLERLKGEARRLSRGEVSGPEAERAKRFLAGTFLMTSVTPEEKATRALNDALFGTSWCLEDEYLPALSAVTTEEIGRVIAKRVDPERMLLLVTGPPLLEKILEEAGVTFSKIVGPGEEILERPTLEY